MKSILVLRHAKSSRKDPDLTDHDRPLNKRGKRDSPLIGRLLKREDLVPDITRLLIIVKKQDPNRDVVRSWSLDRR
jgi:phosphohistidine phosphatase SixA